MEPDEEYEGPCCTVVLRSGRELVVRGGAEEVDGRLRHAREGGDPFGSSVRLTRVAPGHPDDGRKVWTRLDVIDAVCEA